MRVIEFFFHIAIFRAGNQHKHRRNLECVIVILVEKHFQSLFDEKVLVFCNSVAVYPPKI